MRFLCISGILPQACAWFALLGKDLKHYVNDLLSQGFITEGKKKGEYVIVAKGKKFLKKYKSIKKFVDSFRI